MPYPLLKDAACIAVCISTLLVLNSSLCACLLVPNNSVCVLLPAADPHKPHSIRDVMTELSSDAGRVIKHTVWIHMCGAYTLYTAVLGVYAYWGPRAGRAIYQLADESADITFGLVTVVTGILGSLGGGLLLDYVGSTLRNANLICALAALGGWVMVQISFLAARSFTTFIVTFALGELLLFLLQAPVAAIGMWSVPPSLRPLAISMTTVAIHLGGDVPSPPLVGLLESKLEEGKSAEDRDQQWRLSMSIISMLLILSGVLFARGACVSHRAADYRKPEGVHVTQGGVSAEGDAETTDKDPLLDDAACNSMGEQQEYDAEGAMAAAEQGQAAAIVSQHP